MSGDASSPDNALLEVTASSLEYWESPGAVVTAFQMAQGVITRSQPDLGDNGTIQLERHPAVAS